MDFFIEFLCCWFVFLSRLVNDHSMKDAIFIANNPVIHEDGLWYIKSNNIENNLYWHHKYR